MKKISASLILLVLLLSGLDLQAQDGKQKSYMGIVGNGSLYFSWGYNTEWYTGSTLHVNQERLGNKYVFENVKAHDHRGWDEGLFQKALTIPQYNYRLGYFFNKKQDFAFEINFDHTKYIITNGQEVNVSGVMNGKPVNKKIVFDNQQGFSYFLNNGANFLLFNLVKRFELYNTKDRLFRLDLLTKAGIGPVIPHVENTLFGQANKPGFQLGGWNTGIETALRCSFLKYGYLEFAQKVDYARYSGLKVYEGTAHQAFGTYELILSAGFMLPTGKHNILFNAK